MSRTEKRITAMSLVLLLLLLATPLAAQEARWKELNGHAVQLYRQGKYSEAISAAEEAVKIAEDTFGPEHPNTLISLNNLGTLYKLQGRYADAEPLFKRILASKEKALGPESIEVAAAMNNLGIVYYEQGRYAQAEPLYQQALAIKQKALGPESADVALSESNLAELYRAEGRNAEAEPLLKQALATRQKLLGPEHLDVASALNNLAMLYESQGRYADAEPLLKQSLAIHQKALGPEHPDVALSLSNLGELYEDQARYAEAEALLKQSLAVYQKTLGPQHPDVAGALNNLAELYLRQGRYAEAEPLLEQSLAIKQKTLGPEHPLLAPTLSNLARVYEREGRYAAAERLLQQALAIHQKALGPESMDVAMTLNNLAAFYKGQGRYAEAEPLLKRALAIEQKALGKGHPDVATVLDNLATLYDDQGKRTEAERIYKQAIEIREKAFGPEHPDVATAKGNLAVLYASEGRYEEAETLQKDALEIWRKKLGADSPAAAVSMNNLGSLLMDEGRYPEAESLYKQVLEIRERKLGPENPAVATVLNDLGSLYGREGRYADAEAVLARAIGIREKAFGADHSLTGWSERNLAEVYFSWGRPGDAEVWFDRGFRNLAKQFDQQFAYMSEKERLAYLALFASTFPEYMSFALLNHSRIPDLSGKMYDLTLWQKGMVATSVAAQRARLAASGDPQALALFEQLAVKKTQLAALANPPQKDREQWQKTVSQLESETNELEGELARRSPMVASERKLSRPSWHEVRDALKKDQAAVEIVRFQFHDGKQWTDKFYYAALVVTPRAEQPAVVMLGEAKDLEAAPMDDYRALVAEPASDGPVNAETGRKFAAAFWEPVAKAVGLARRVYVSPDGALNQVSLGLAPLSGGRLLMNAHDIRLVSSTKDLLRPGRGAVANTAVLVGNPKFDMSEAEGHAALESFKRLSAHPQAVAEQPEPSPARAFPATKARAVRGGVLAPLPGTQAEIESLKALLAGHGWKVESYTQTEALEERVQQVRGPRVLHLATHGFFVAEPEQGTIRRPGSSEQTPSPMDDPMLRSGLFLAGADRALRGLPPAEGLENGVLTAFLASQLNLQGTELVVLSACETGLGETENGEGVFGLRRALQEAGASAVLMSLWSVPDQETRELMESFYTHWLDGEDKQEALRHAELEEREAVKKRYGRDLPYYWGAFVLVGR